MRPRPVRCLHGPDRRAPGRLLSAARRRGRGARDHHHRGRRRRRPAASGAAGLPRPRRLSVRLLHPGPDLFGPRGDRGTRGRLAERGDR